MDPMVSVDANVAIYRQSLTPTERYASFDYCFNYFQEQRETHALGDSADDGSRQISCLQLGFYLASWGMLRGSTALLRKSVRYLMPVIDVIWSCPPEIWSVDANAYSPEARALILDVAGRIRAAFPERASETLVTKIMLGVFGCVPAFDRNFRLGFGPVSIRDQDLARIGRFYEDHADEIERSRVPTLDFDSGSPTDRLYTRAKVIDMVFFVEGDRRARALNKTSKRRVPRRFAGRVLVGDDDPWGVVEYEAQEALSSDYQDKDGNWTIEPRTLRGPVEARWVDVLGYTNYYIEGFPIDATTLRPVTSKKNRKFLDQPGQFRVRRRAPGRGPRESG